MTVLAAQAAYLAVHSKVLMRFIGRNEMDSTVRSYVLFVIQADDEDCGDDGDGNCCDDDVNSHNVDLKTIIIISFCLTNNRRRNIE